MSEMSAAEELAALSAQVGRRHDLTDAVADTRRHVLRELRGEDGDPDLADRIEAGAEMSDYDKAFVDAIIHGQGFLVDGKRVQPARVTLLRWEGT